MPIAEMLNRMITTSEVITITYNGGSRPGQPRKVLPISLSVEELIAVEPGSHIKKHYKLKQIALVESSSGERAINTEVKSLAVSDIPNFETLSEYVARFESELRAAGWHIFTSETSFAIGTYFKNGKPRKTPSVAIQYCDRSFLMVMDLDTGRVAPVEQELTGRERPWRVDSWRFKEAKTFTELPHAFKLFIQEAQASDPATAKVLFSPR